MTNLTFVKGSRDPGTLDPVSAAILEVASTGTSIFDPVVCEIAYRWFCPPGGAVLDPFAGGSVRGIVASKLGRPYTGIDLRAEQIDANRAQAAHICGEPMPRWVCGDSREVMPALAQQGIAPQFDFVFSCPPYADLEVYSDDPRDLSTLEYDEFRAAYASIIAGACALLKPDRFACFVVGDVRDRQGLYRNFPGHTIDAFEAAGLRLYNEAILVTAVGSLPIRAGKQFAATRKLGRTHQSCLVLVKGDPRKATEAIGEVEFGELAAGQESPLAGVEAL
jgi:DNA modification methylase